MDASRSLPLLCRGQIDGMESDPHFVVKNAAGKQLGVHEWGEARAIDHKTALHFVITWLEANLGDRKVVAAGHRVVLSSYVIRRYFLIGNLSQCKEVTPLSRHSIMRWIVKSAAVKN